MDLFSYNREADDQTPSLYPPYASTVKRSPCQPLVRIPQTLTEVTGPSAVWEQLMGPAMLDMTRQHKAEPIGQRIIVSGRVLDDNGRPVPRTVVEIWQANAAGRYIHARDQWNAPIDPNFTGVWPRSERRRGPLPVRHRQARCLSLGQPLQRVAAGAHPFLTVRPCLRYAPRHPNVLPRRSPNCHRSDRQRRAGRSARPDG